MHDVECESYFHHFENNCDDRTCQGRRPASGPGGIPDDPDIAAFVAHQRGDVEEARKAQEAREAREAQEAREASRRMKEAIKLLDDGYTMTQDEQMSAFRDMKRLVQVAKTAKAQKAQKEAP